MLTKPELRQLQDKELMEELTKSSRELLKAKMEHSGGTLKETHRLVELKRHIARMKTIMGENLRSAPVREVAAQKRPAKVVEPGPKKAKAQKI